MIKFAAHYLLTDSGLLLKNGMALVEDNGTIHFIDTKGELVEVEKMIFHSGLLMGAFEFIKSKDLPHSPGKIEEPLPLFNTAIDKESLAIKDILDLTIQFQIQHPEMNVTQIIHWMEQVLLSRNYLKQTIPGLYLLAGLDLDNLRFTAATRLKKII